MSDKSFVHLHNHSEYSMLDGAARIKQLVAKAAELAMPAIAITDHGNSHGAYEFWKQATAHNIKPIIGIEAYLAPGSRKDKTRVRWGDGGGDAYNSCSPCCNNIASVAAPNILTYFVS